jgi:hypothetical protein
MPKKVFRYEECPSCGDRAFDSCPICEKAFYELIDVESEKEPEVKKEEVRFNYLWFS